MSGLLFYKPMAIQIAINLLFSFSIFPVSCNYVAMDSMGKIISPLSSAIDSLSTLFHSSLDGSATFEDWIACGDHIRSKRTESQSLGLGPVLEAVDYLSVDLCVPPYLLGNCLC